MILENLTHIYQYPNKDSIRYKYRINPKEKIEIEFII